MRYLLIRLTGILCLCVTTSVAAAPQERDLTISVVFETGEVHIDVDMLVEAKPREVWAVLTDFDHMAEFISNLTSSRVLSRSGNKVTIEQKGKMGVGPLSVSFDSVRELSLSPFERIRSQQMSGIVMKKMEGLTRLVSEDSGKTRVLYHADAEVNNWLPPFVGRGFIEDETREQFAQMRQEVLRRKQTGATP